MTQSDHELIAGYVLDALDDTDRRHFEQHLSDCTVCSEELESLAEAACSLAYALDDPPPPDDLRRRLLAQLQPSEAAPAGERRRRPRLSLAPALLASTVIAAALAVAVTAFEHSDNSGSETRVQSRLAALLAQPTTRVLDLSPQRGRLVVGANGQALLLAVGFPKTAGSTAYQVWVRDPLGQPLMAARFTGGRQRLIVPLHRLVRRGATVTVTREPRPVATPSGPIVAQSA